MRGKAHCATASENAERDSWRDGSRVKDSSSYSLHVCGIPKNIFTEQFSRAGSPHAALHLTSTCRYYSLILSGNEALWVIYYTQCSYYVHALCTS